MTGGKAISKLCANRNNLYNLFLITILNFTGLRENLILLMTARDFRSPGVCMGCGSAGGMVIILMLIENAQADKTIRTFII